MAQKTFGTFTKDGATRVAYSAARAVDLRYRGWTELQPEPEAAAETENKAGRSSAASS